MSLRSSPTQQDDTRFHTDGRCQYVRLKASMLFVYLRIPPVPGLGLILLKTKLNHLSMIIQHLSL